jgi:hypothetical protein
VDRFSLNFWASGNTAGSGQYPVVLEDPPPYDLSTGDRGGIYILIDGRLFPLQAVDDFFQVGQQ